MTNRGERLEHVVDFLIPYALILLLVVIICEFFFKTFAEEHALFFVTADYLVLGLFILDLIFKYKRAKTVPGFLKSSWIDIIAVFPFFLVFRVVEAVGFIRGVVETGQEAQKLFHAGLEVQKEIKGAAGISREIKLASELEKEAKVIKEVEIITQEGARSEKLARFMRPVFRLPRMVKGVEFFEKPKQKV